MKRFEGKTAVITGGSSGIGLATAQLLQSEGGRVVVTGRSDAALESARHTLGERALVLKSDTSKLASIDALVEKTRSSFGTVDLLFINAGIAKFAPLEAIDEKFYDEQHDTNLKGALFTIQRFLPLLQPGSSIVLNTSVVDEKGMPMASVYASTKAGLRSLGRSLAAELLPKGIRVNAVSPGPIVTPITTKNGMTPEQNQAFEAQLLQMVPMKRFGQSEEVARAVLFLAVDATFTTGSELPVDGGFGQL